MVILTEYPQQCPPPAWPNLILSASGTDIAYAERAGPLSVKAVFRGVEVHEVNGARLAVKPDSYLILNHGQRYSSYSGSLSAVETLTIFFAPGFAEEVLGSLATPADKLLDNEPRAQAVYFFEKLYAHDRRVYPLLETMHGAVRSAIISSGWLEDQFRALLERLLCVHRDLYPELLRMPPLRLSTKVEIFRRLYRARDFMASTCDRPLTLTDIAAVACLSPHHFLRLFRSAFGETPHKFLMRLRLEQARAFLLETSRSVTDICFDCGFASVGSFSSLFKRRYSTSPTGLRRTMLRNQKRT